MTLTKEEARRVAAERRAAAASSAAEAALALMRHAERLTARCVAAYMPIRTEIDPLPLARAICSQKGASLALPAIVGEAMEFRAFAAETSLRSAPFGLSEPDGPPVEPDLLLVPLLAFDRRGARLGYGKGHYDRYIASRPQVRTVGVAFAAQELHDMPLEPHDQLLDAIATEREWINPSEASCVSSS